MTNSYKLIAFDLDGTLADSKAPIDPLMADALAKLLERYEICIITGGTQEQITRQVVDKLNKESKLDKLHLMPTGGASYLKFQNNEWVTIYEKNLPSELRVLIMQALKEEAQKLGYWENVVYGDIIEDRKSQITFSALGQKAPVEEKEKWDPSGVKKENLRLKIAHIFPDLEVRSGGTTSIDVTMKNIDKAFGVHELLKRNNINTKDILFIGDRLNIGGNDFPVIATGVGTQEVNSWHETLTIIQTLLSE